MRMPFWYLWALTVPLLQWFARRFPLDRMRWLSGAALHMAVAFAVSLAHYALELGVQIFYGFAGAEMLYEDRRVVGVRTGDKGVDKDGERKGNFEPGSETDAKLSGIAVGRS